MTSLILKDRPVRTQFSNTKKRVKPGQHFGPISNVIIHISQTELPKCLNVFYKPNPKVISYKSSPAKTKEPVSFSNTPTPKKLGIVDRSICREVVYLTFEDLPFFADSQIYNLRIDEQVKLDENGQEIRHLKLDFVLIEVNKHPKDEFTLVYQEGLIALLFAKQLFKCTVVPTGGGCSVILSKPDTEKYNTATLAKELVIN
jgi:hypothetical protein